MDPKNHKDLLKKKNVVAIAKGEKWINGENTGEEALLVFVSKKKSKTWLWKKDLIPDKVDGIITDVVGGDQIRPLGLTGRVRPIPGGYSCSHTRVTAGTIGGWFVDKDGDLVGLSNNHVLAFDNLAKRIGEPGGGHLIVQPGVHDHRFWQRSKNQIGRVKDFVHLNKQDNLQDSAIFAIDSSDLVKPGLHKLGKINDFRDNLKIGEMVQKVGRTTGHTTGKVIATNGIIHVNYGKRLGSIEFEDQIITSFMSEGGDSGSLLLDMNNNIVGLLFAGSSQISIHNKIKYPRDKYGLKIYDPEAIKESYLAFLNVDDTIERFDEIEDLNFLANKARTLASQGKKVELNIVLKFNQK